MALHQPKMVENNKKYNGCMKLYNNAQNKAYFLGMRLLTATL